MRLKGWIIGDMARLGDAFGYVVALDQPRCPEDIKTSWQYYDTSVNDWVEANDLSLNCYLLGSKFMFFITNVI